MWPNLSQWRDRIMWTAALVLLATAGCNPVANMLDQPHYEPLEATEFFPDGTTARPRVDGTVSRDGGTSTWGDEDEQAVQRPPVTLDLVRHGQERFNIYCSVCHGRDGYGRGMVVQRGFPEPPSYHSERLRSVSDEYIYSVVTRGLGKMPSYRGRVSPRDRWAIIAYVRALQLSQHARLEDVPQKEQAGLLDASEEPRS